MEESFSDDGTRKQTVMKRWRDSNLYDFIPSEDKKAYLKSITRHSDTFKRIVATTRKVVEDTGFLGDKNSK